MIDDLGNPVFVTEAPTHAQMMGNRFTLSSLINQIFRFF